MYREGDAAVGYFEHSDYEQWEEDHRWGGLKDYGCEAHTISTEVIDEVLQELPERVQPSHDLVLSQLPECDQQTTLSPGR